MYIKDQAGGGSVLSPGDGREGRPFRLAGQAWSNVNIVAIRRGRRAGGLAWSRGARRPASGGSRAVPPRLSLDLVPGWPGGASVSHATRPGLPAAGQSGTIAGYRLDGYVGQGPRAVVYLPHDERPRAPGGLKGL